ncbi:MAG TPA: hypothetical protein DCX32_01065 [Candidatus Moranbacteria bacterium]|nr:MAG: Glycosyl transferase group 1 [Parcubacteria group bacterium GW2011_GWC1_45_14]HAV11122.1 hypothetical protein [Candidatus Moranbacteria bacterium]
MRIAIFTNNYLPNPFGVSTSIEAFRTDFEKLGHSVYVFAPQMAGYADQNPNVFRYPSFDFKYKISFPLAIPFSRKIDKILDKLEIDIIHSQHPNLLGDAAKKWAKKKNVPLVFTWHTLYDQYTHFASPFIPRKLAAWWTIGNAVSYANRSDFVVTPTSSVEKIIRGWGVNNGNISSIPTGVDTEKFDKADKDIVRKKYGIADDKTVLTIVSRFTEEKNIKFLFEAVSSVLRKRKDVVFLAKGNGNLLSEMGAYVSNEGLGGKVVFASEDDRKEDVFAAGDIFVYASKSETQGMVISEALYTGLPIVAVSATGVSDQVMDGASGFLVSENQEEFSKALEKLIDDKDLRAKFSENAKKIARENYTSSICAERMLKVYENLISRKK